MTPGLRALSPILRGHSRPHLLDWDRDGQIDLVDGGLYGGSSRWRLQVAAGPLAGKDEVLLRPFPLSELPDRTPYDFRFVDWDGDGVFDLLFAGYYLDPDRTRWLYDIYWCRNTSRHGEPQFDPPVRLLSAPAQSATWHYDGYAVVDRGRAGLQDLVLGVSKRQGPYPKEGRLVLFRREAEPGP